MAGKGPATSALGHRSDRAWQKAAAAREEYSKTVDEVEDRFNLLLDLRDHAIKKMEEQLGRLRTLVTGTDQRLNFKVLVVEESPALRTALVAALQRKFYASGAADLRSALECLQEEPDAILADVHLSRTLAASVRQEISRISGRPIPLMTICDPTNTAVLEHLRELGIYAAFPKPFRLKDIVARVETLCAETQGNDLPTPHLNPKIEIQVHPVHDRFIDDGLGDLEQTEPSFAVAAVHADETRKETT